MTELQLNHWYNGLPTSVKKTILNWCNLSLDEKLNLVRNPSREFIKADKKFREETERFNY